MRHVLDTISVPTLWLLQPVIGNVSGEDPKTAYRASLKGVPRGSRFSRLQAVCFLQAARRGVASLDAAVTPLLPSRRVRCSSIFAMSRTWPFVRLLSVNPVQSHPKAAYSSCRFLLILLALVVLRVLACSAVADF